MPELPLNVASVASAPTVVQSIKSKDDIEKYASIIREVGQFANSDVGKMLITRFIPPKAPVVGNPMPAQGEYKPMPAQNGPTGVGYSDNFRPASSVQPMISGPERVIVKEVPTPVPLFLTPEDQYNRFMVALTELTKHVGEEKTMKEAIEWATSKKDLIIAMTQPLKINPPQM